MTGSQLLQQEAEAAFEDFRERIRLELGESRSGEMLQAFDECIRAARRTAIPQFEGPPMSLKQGVYQHYRGGLYTVLFTARHHESDQPMVVYVSHQHSTVNVRPLKGYPSDPDGWLDRPPGAFVKRFESV